MTRRESSGGSRRAWVISVAAALGVIGFVAAAQWNSSLARQEFITSAQRVLITEAEQAQREQERLRTELAAAEARVQTFQEADVGSQAARAELNRALAEARLETGLVEVERAGHGARDLRQPAPGAGR